MHGGGSPKVRDAAERRLEIDRASRRMRAEFPRYKARQLLDRIEELRRDYRRHWRRYPDLYGADEDTFVADRVHLTPGGIRALRQMGRVEARRALVEGFSLPRGFTLDLTQAVDKVRTADPEAALHDGIARAASVCEYLEFMIESEGTVFRTVTGSKGVRQEESVYVQLLGQWTDRQMRLITQALRAGIEGPPRTMTILDEDARILVDVFVVAMQQVDPQLDPAVVRAVISRGLRESRFHAAA
jgi:hypothetical protein